MGVLSALPIIAAGNICCCMWIIAGGVIAAYLLQQNHPVSITPADGALVGLLAGLIGALVQVVVSIPIGLMVAPMERAMLQRFLDMAGNMPPDMRDMLERFSRGDNAPAAGVFFIISRIIALMFWLFVGAIFSTIGGLIGSLIFKKQTPPGTIDVTPQS